MKELNEISCLSIDCFDSDIATELGLVGSATGNVKHTIQLHMMTYKQAMATNETVEWDVLVVKEHNIFVKYKVWKAVHKSKIPKGVKGLSSTWAMNPKANGDKRA
eukprot:10257052-Ditylum_brightwellii.AAC.1